MEHHPTFSPSSFPMLKECPCFERAEDEAAMLLEPTERVSYRDRGSLLHEVFAERLLGRLSEGEAHLTPQESEGIAWAIDYVLTNTTNEYPIEVEQQVVLMDDSFNVVTFGTGDVLNGSRLFDLKTGDYHNYWLQIAIYALAQMDRLGLDEIMATVMFTRFKKVHELLIKRAEAHTAIFAVVNAVLDPERKPKANPYCRWCKRILTCPAVVHLVTGEEIERYEIEEPNELSSALTRARLLKDWASKIEVQARRMALSGTEIPGYELKSRQGAREIMDVKRAYELCGLSPDEFIILCNLPIGALEDAIALKEEIPKSHAKRQVNERLAAVIRRKAPTVKLAALTHTEPTEQ